MKITHNNYSIFRLIHWSITQYRLILSSNRTVGQLYLFVHISYKILTPCIFYIHLISYEIHAFDFIWNMHTFGGLCAYGKSSPFYFSAYSIWNFILISSCLFSISLFALTQQYFFRAGGVLMFGGSLSEGLGSLFWRRFSVIFLGQ